MLIREHALERYWLERRLELLEILDDYAEDVLNNQGVKITENDKKIQLIIKHYRDVINPGDLADTIKSLYAPEYYRKNSADIVT